MSAPRPFQSEATFPQVDGRSYIQGISILTRMAEAALDALRIDTEVAPARLYVKRTKYTQLTLNNGLIVGAIGTLKLGGAATSIASMSAEHEGAPIGVQYCPDPDHPVDQQTVSPPYPIQRFQAVEAYGSTQIITATDGPTFLWALIEANKRTLAHWTADRFAGKPRIELVEATDFWFRPTGMSDGGTVVLSTLSDRVFGDRQYIMNEAQYRDEHGDPQTLRLQYSVSSPE